MAITKRLRFEILRRDNHACRYCGAIAPDAELTVDHVVPIALGGTDEPSNLVAACKDCNSGKTSVVPDQPVVEDVSADALRWSAAMKRASELALTSRSRQQEVLDHFLAHWNDWTYKDWRVGPDGRRILTDVTVELPGGWQQSVTSILAAGLPIELLADCIAIAMGAKGVKDEFRYMCGVAWNKVRELQGIASALIEADAVDDGREPEPETPNVTGLAAKNAVARSDGRAVPPPEGWR